MKDSWIPTIEELTQRRRNSLAASAQIIRRHPDLYTRLKAQIRRILSKPLEIGDYYAMAKSLADLLKELSQHGQGSLFHYYYIQIDPRQMGRAEYLRAHCSDLDEQLRCIDAARRSRARLRVIQ